MEGMEKKGNTNFFYIVFIYYNRQEGDWDYLGWWVDHYKVISPNNRYGGCINEEMNIRN